MYIPWILFIHKMCILPVTKGIFRWFLGNRIQYSKFSLALHLKIFCWACYNYVPKVMLLSYKAQFENFAGSAWPRFDLSRSPQMLPNERPYMTSYPSLIIHLAVSARVSKLRPSEICLPSIWNWPLQVTLGQRQWCQMKPYIWLPTHHSNSVVILNRFGDIGHWKPVWPGLTFQGHSTWRSKTMAPNETSYVTHHHDMSRKSCWLLKMDKTIDYFFYCRNSPVSVLEFISLGY